MVHVYLFNILQSKILQSSESFFKKAPFLSGLFVYFRSFRNRNTNIVQLNKSKKIVDLEGIDKLKLQNQ